MKAKVFVRVLKVAAAVFICLLVGLVVLVAVTIRSSGGCSGGTWATGRTVSTNSDGWSTSANYGPDTATITTAGHTIVVAPTKLIVDGIPVASIEESVKVVNVTVRKGEVSFVADGKSVARSRR